MTPLKVVRVIARLNIGGPARHATLLNDGLRRHGCDPLLVYGSIDASEGSLEGVVTALGLRARKLPALGRRINLWNDVKVFVQLTSLLFEEQPDVVHTHTAKAGTVGRLAALLYNMTRGRSRRCLVVHTYHGHVLSGYFGRIMSLAVQFAERRLAFVTDRIIVISRSQQRDICDRYRIVPAAKTNIIELGLDLDVLFNVGRDDAGRLEVGFPRDAVVYGYVGRLVPIKDLETLVRAFGILAARESMARLLIVGDGEERTRLSRIVAELSLGDRVRFTGWRHDLNAIYGSLDVVVLSSLNEGTPVSVIEAMAAARPIVATNVGGVPDVVSHERSGLVVPPGNAQALADAMRRLCVDDQMRMRLGQAGRADVRNRFDRRRLEQEVSDVYRRALAIKRGTVPDSEATLAT